MSSLERGPSIQAKVEGSDHVERTDSMADTVQHAVTHDEQSRLRHAVSGNLLGFDKESV